MWTQELLQPIANELNLYAVQGAVCEELALPKSSAADVAISSTKLVQQRPEDIKAIIEVKMSIVWNWEYKNNGLFCLGDYTTHSGNPGLLRSDSMLKAIGKSVNIRISSNKAHRIPIVVLGNTPITKSYYEKVDHLKKTGIIQGFWSVNPKPRTDNKEDKKTTPSFGFRRFDDYQELREQFHNLITNRFSYFSGMKNELELGKIIERANRETTYEKKAELFLRLLQESN